MVPFGMYFVLNKNSKMNRLREKGINKLAFCEDVWTRDVLLAFP